MLAELARSPLQLLNQFLDFLLVLGFELVDRSYIRLINYLNKDVKGAYERKTNQKIQATPISWLLLFVVSLTPSDNGLIF